MKTPKLSIRFKTKSTSEKMKLIMCAVSCGFTTKENDVSYLNRITKTVNASSEEFPALFNSVIKPADLIKDFSSLTSQEGLRKIKQRIPSKVKYKQVIISTKLSLPTTFWKNGKAIGSYSKINKSLLNIEKNIRLLYEALLKTGREITPEYLKDEIKKHNIIENSNFSETKENSSGTKTFHLNKQMEVSTIPTVLTSYIDYKMASWQRLGERASGTYMAYKRFKTWIEKYEAAKMNGKKIDLLTLENLTLQDFVQWILQQRKEDGTPYKLNYINEIKKQFKVFINEARNEDELKLSDKLNIKKKFMKKKTEEVNDISLTIEQLEKVKKVQFDDDEKVLDKVRDLFLIGCNCGFRYSDLKNIKKIFHSEQDGYYFELQKSEKTKTYSFIPVHDNYIVDLFEKKYNGEFNFSMHENTFNEHIKTVMMRAKFYDQNLKVSVTHIDPLTGKNIETKKYFGDMVSSRTCRKTFASNMVRVYGVPISVVMSWTGHQTEKNFRSYLRLSDTEYYQMALAQMKIMKQSSTMRVA